MIINHLKLIFLTVQQLLDEINLNIDHVLKELIMYENHFQPFKNLNFMTIFVIIFNLFDHLNNHQNCILFRIRNLFLFALIINIQ